MRAQIREIPGVGVVVVYVGVGMDELEVIEMGVVETGRVGVVCEVLPLVVVVVLGGNVVVVVVVVGVVLLGVSPLVGVGEIVDTGVDTLLVVDEAVEGVVLGVGDGKHSG
ncbi:hypothetical protein TURU_033390 [Turdus rufiventris]|nr:hypothetical protein TURU_033390 [Turdus rufiventris]